MLPLILTLLAVAVGLVALFWTGTLLAQGYFYDSPTDGMAWRAPAAAGVLALFLAIWSFIDYRLPRTTDTIFTFSTEHVESVDRFVSVRKSELGEEQEIPFTRRPLGSNRDEFIDEKGERWARSRSGMMVAIIVEEKKGDEVKRTRFNAEMKDGKFAPQRTRGVEQTLRYIEERGSRFMYESQPGKIFSYHKSQFLGNVVLNLIHFVLWFLVLWLLMRFAWPHALGFAFICWLAFTLVLVPFILSKSRDAADRRAKASAAMVRKPLMACRPVQLGREVHS
jgi:hypothetical protein